jgi:hypothetical protein
MKNQLLYMIKESLYLKDKLVILNAFFESLYTKHKSFKASEKFVSVNTNKCIELYVH